VSSRGERIANAATYAVLFAASVGLNTISLFLVPTYVAGQIGIGVVIALLGNVGLGVLGAWGVRRAAGAVAVALGWLVVFGLVSAISRGGDVVLAGKLPDDHAVVVTSTLWIFAGLFGSAGPFLAAILRSAGPRQSGNQRDPSSWQAGTTPSG
jgi:hypothetical protein